MWKLVGTKGLGEQFFSQIFGSPSLLSGFFDLIPFYQIGQERFDVFSLYGWFVASPLNLTETIFLLLFLQLVCCITFILNFF